jgi:hypothetical protein
MGTDKNKFWQNGFVVLNNHIPIEILKIVSDYLIMKLKNQELNSDSVSEFTKYGDTLCESLLSHFQPTVELYSGKKIVPTYSYVRIYQTGQRLFQHTDRPACEYTISFPVSYKAKKIWPLFILKDQRKINIHLDTGDLLLYKGSEIVHGRDIFPGKQWIQIFLHYVDKQGKNADWKFDKRIRLGSGRRHSHAI